MNEKDIKEILEKFFKHVMQVTYKDPLMIYDTGALLGLVGKTVGVPDTQAKLLQEIIDGAKKTGRINNKKLKGLYKAIVETSGDAQFTALLFDEINNLQPTAEKISKIIELVFAPSYKGIYRNMSNSGNSMNHDLNASFQTLETVGQTRRMPDGPTGFVPAYTNLLAALAAMDQGVIGMQPYRKVVNELSKGEFRLNRSQSDVFVNSAEQIASMLGYDIVNLHGEIDNFQMTNDDYNSKTRLLDIITADEKLIEKYGWRDLLDPEVSAKLSKELDKEILRKKEEAKNKPKLNIQGQAAINALKKWKGTQPDSWFGNNPVIINSGHIGLEEAALDIHNRNKGKTGGFAPPGFIGNAVSNPKIFPQKGIEYNLQPIYINEEVSPGLDIDSGKVHDFIEKYSTPELREHIRNLEKLGYDAPLTKLAEAYIYAKPTKTKEGIEYDRGWSIKKGKQAEFNIAKQMNVDSANLNVFFITNKTDEILEKTIMYSLYGEFKLPNNRKSPVTQNEIDRVADNLRKKSKLKRPLEYWNKAALSQIELRNKNVSDLNYETNTPYIEGSIGEGKRGIKKNTLIIDLTNIEYQELGNALQKFQEELIGKGKAIVKVNEVLKIVDIHTNASQLFPESLGDYKIHVSGDSNTVTGYYKDLAQDIVQALVSPEQYYEVFARKQIMQKNSTGVQTDYGKSPVAINDYTVINNEKMENVIKDGKPDYNNPNVVTQIDAIRDGKQKGFLIREADLLKKLGVRTVKEAIKILETNPELRLANFDAGQELKVNINGWNKMESYKFGEKVKGKDGNYTIDNKKPYVEIFKEILGNSTMFFKKAKYLNPQTNQWETGDEKFMDPDNLVDYVSNQNEKRFDKFGNTLEPKPMWLLEVGDVVPPSVKIAQATNEALRALQQQQELNNKYWSYGQDPKAITRVNKRNLPAKVYNLAFIRPEFTAVAQQLFAELTAYDFGPRDFDMQRLMYNLPSDVYKSESLQEIVNAILTDDIQLTNAVKPVDEKVLNVARERNFLGKLTMFYKLMGRHNAVLDAVVLNISKELLSRNYDIDGSMEQVQNFLSELNNIDDLNSSKNLNNILNETLGNHHEHLAAKILEVINQLGLAELEILQRFPEIKEPYKNLRAIDKIRQEGIVDETVISSEGSVLDYEVSKGKTEMDGLIDKLLESFEGITVPDLDKLQESMRNMMDSTPLHTDEMMLLQNQKQNYQWISTFEEKVTNLLYRFANPKQDKRFNELTTSLLDDLNVHLQHKGAQIFYESLKQIEFDGPGGILDDIFLKKNKVGYDYELIFLNKAIKGFANHYLNEDRLRIDNLFGLEDAPNYTYNEIEPVRTPQSKIFTEGSLEGVANLSPHLLRDGIDNFFAGSPTALQALMLNDTNVNPAIQDNFIKDFLREYGDLVINVENIKNSYGTVMPLASQRLIIDNGNLNELIKLMYKVSDNGVPPKVDFNKVKSVEDYIVNVLGTINDLDDLDVDWKQLSDKLIEVFPVEEHPMLQNFLDQPTMAFLLEIVETNLKRLALRPENMQKLIDIELSKQGLKDVNFNVLKNKVLGSNIFKVLTGEGDSIMVTPEDISDLKKQSKRRLQDMVGTFNRMLGPNSNVYFELESNLPNKWELKVAEGKQFNPFTINPSKGADSFYHLVPKFRDSSIGFAESLDASPQLASIIDYILTVEQPTNYINPSSLHGNHNSSMLKNGILNSYLFSDSINEPIGHHALNKQLQKEQLEIMSIVDAIKEKLFNQVSGDNVAYSKLVLSIQSLQDNLMETFKLAAYRNQTFSREIPSEKGVRTFYGLDDTGAFPLLKLKFGPEFYSNTADAIVFTSAVMPAAMRMKSLDAVTLKDIEAKLLDDKVNFEIGQYVEVLQDLTEKKLGRKNLDNGLNFANELNNKMFYGDGGLFEPVANISKDFKLVNLSDQFAFIGMINQFNKGVDLNNIPRPKNVTDVFPDNKSIQDYLQGSYNKYENHFKNIYNLPVNDGGRIDMIKWFEDTTNRYKIMTDRLVTPEPGPVDVTNFKDFGAMFNMQWAKDFNPFVGPVYEDKLFKDSVEISSQLRNYQDGLTEYINTNLSITSPQLMSGKGNDLAIIGPKGWQIVEPKRPAIPLGPGAQPSDIVLKGLSTRGYNQYSNQIIKGPNFGEGDPFANAYTAPQPKKIKTPRDFTMLKNLIKNINNIKYQPARYEYNFGRGKNIQLYTGGGSPGNLVPHQKMNPFLRFFRNYRTLSELPYFYNRHAGKSGPRAYVGYYLTEPVYLSDHRKAKKQPRVKLGIAPVKAGIEFDPKVFEDWYRNTKSVHLKQNLIARPLRAYGRANAAAFAADMIYSVNAYNKNVGDMTYQEFIEQGQTLKGREAINKIFLPIQKLMEAPYKAKENLTAKSIKLEEQLKSGEINQGMYIAEKDKLNQLYTLADAGTFTVTQVANIFQGFIEAVPGDMGRDLEIAQQQSKLVAENYRGATEEEWLENIQKSYSDLAATKHLSYNYSDDYYNKGRRFVNKMLNKFMNTDKEERDNTLDSAKDIYSIPGGLK